MKALSLIFFFCLFALMTALRATAAAVNVHRDGALVTASTASIHVRCDLKTGLCDFSWNGGRIGGMECAARLPGGADLLSSDYGEHRCEANDVAPVRDGFGRGVRITIHHRSAGRPELRQQLWVYEDRRYLLTTVDLVSPTVASSNYLAPFVLDSEHVAGAALRLPGTVKPRALFVPFDNDEWVRYNSDYARESCEVTAVYDNASRHGFVLGSVDHDVWKTGFTLGVSSGDGLQNVRAVAGATGARTHDTEPHGLVSGTVISSPRIFVGCFADWRDGLETYGKANAIVAPPLKWSGGVPFGWNSWAAYRTHLDYKRPVEVADFIKKRLQPAGFRGERTVYINLDSFWDNLSEAQLLDFVRHVHAAGQKAGIYWTPFTWWGSNRTQRVEGTGERWSYGDALLTNGEGKLVGTLKGGKPMDPTHPATLARIDWCMERFVRWGFDFVKLDFLNYGALEGHHYDPKVTTGVGAYGVGMRRIVADLDPKKIGRPFFISLSIAPLFPAGYAHSRRVSCDAFGKISDSEYMLNSVTYGWWINDTLYRYNDPDHTVLKQSEEEARTRLNASVIAGTVLLDSDDLTDAVLQARAERLLTNKEINAVAREGRSFRPVEGDSGDRAETVFVRRDSGGRFMTAVFNFGDEPETLNLELGRMGLSDTSAYRVRDLWSGHEMVAARWIRITLPAHGSTILRLTPER